MVLWSKNIGILLNQEEHSCIILVFPSSFWTNAFETVVSINRIPSPRLNINPHLLFYFKQILITLYYVSLIVFVFIGFVLMQRTNCLGLNLVFFQVIVKIIRCKSDLPLIQENILYLVMSFFMKICFCFHQRMQRFPARQPILSVSK